MATYGLFHDKEKGILRISTFNNVMKDIDTVKVWNEYWYICTNRKLLRAKGHEILNRWKAEARLRVEFLDNVLIETKYK